MDGKVDLDEERRISMIRRCVNALETSMDEMITAAGDDEKMRNEIVGYIDKTCIALGCLGKHDTGEAMKQIKDVLTEMEERWGQ